jgi:tetratricopeptide (TPR) repeat protein
MACNSKPASERQSPKQAETSPPSGPNTTNANPAEGGSISYAQNPERFRKMETVAPPFHLTDPKTAMDFFDVGVHEDNLQHYEQAIVAYEKALRLKPDWALVCVREAKDYRHLARTRDAIAQLNRAAKIDPHYWDAYAELALTYKDGGETQHAIEAASKLLTFPPLQIPTHNQLGYWYEEVGDRQKAKQQFEMYRDLAQKNKAEWQSERYKAALLELEKLGG